ncbi:MAG: hypothetical protein PWQ89_1850 [Verrucomicrobiota bacterium]|jgi:hypothetical protein|nr:hypothetical protein [Verrucomicrobiota bacterium]
MDKQQTVICLKWGTRYGPEYVNRLYSMTKRNTGRPLRFVCITDDTSGLIPEVETRPMPEFDLPETFRYKGFRRMFLFKESLYDLKGKVLHLDLDLIVTGSIDAFFDYEPDAPYIVAENWTQPGEGIGNMSVFRYEIGALTKIWERFSADPLGMLKMYNNSQTFCSRTLGSFPMYPLEWCIGFKQSLIPRWPLNFFITPKPPQKQVKIVAFTGKPDLEDVIAGEWPTPKAWKKLYKHVRPTPWLEEIWK